jgi:nitrate/nitrite-specific signal transduction histidine kinase
LRKSGHWGLKSMRERCAQLRAKCKMTSAAVAVRKSKSLFSSLRGF